MKFLKKIFGSKPKAADINYSEGHILPSPAQSERSMGTAYNSVVLIDAGSKKLMVIKAIMDLTGLGLREAKAITDATPSLIKAGVFRHEAELIKKELEKAGATVELG